MTSPVANNRVLTAKANLAAPAAKPLAAAAKPVALGDTLQVGRPVAAAQPQAQGKIAKYESIAGAVGGGLTGMVLGGLGALIGLSRGHASLMIWGVGAVGAAAGYGIGLLSGKVNEKIVGTVSDDPSKQWSTYMAMGGAAAAARSFKDASALGRGASGVGALAVGGFELVREAKALKVETKAGGKTTDNQVRVGGAAAATLGGAAMLAAAFPFAAAIAGPLAIAGGAAALAGFGALVVGRYMDDQR